MNDRMQELVVDLIDGRLSAHDERVARTRIDADPAFRAEYEAQLSIISVLEASPTPMMTSEERSSLHTALRRQLHLDETPAPVVAAPPRWQRWWAPVGGFAVAAALLVGAVVVLPGSLSETDSGASVDVALDETTTIATSGASSEEFVDRIEVEGVGDGEKGATDSAVAGGEASADTEDPSAQTYDAVSALPSLPYLTAVDLDTLEREFSSDTDLLSRRLSESSTKASAAEFSLVEACLDMLRAEDSISAFSPIATTTVDGTTAVVVSVSPGEGDPYLAVLDVGSCQEIAITRG